MRSHSVTFHPTQVNTPQPDRLVLDLPTLEGWKAELVVISCTVIPCLLVVDIRWCWVVYSGAEAPPVA